MTSAARGRCYFVVLAFVLALLVPSANADPVATAGPGGPSSGDGPSPGDVLVSSNFGPGGTFDTGSGYQIASQVIASPFTSSMTVLFSDAQLAMFSSGGTTANVFLETDSSGSPGTIIDTLSQNGSITGSASVVTWECNLCPLLSAGTQYWLVAQQGNGATAWDLSNSDSGPFAFNEIGSATGPWSPTSGIRPTFEIDGDVATPEPVSVFLLTGLLGLGGVGRALYRKSLGSARSSRQRFQAVGL
jgi:hypothetical protein